LQSAKEAAAKRLLSFALYEFELAGRQVWAESAGGWEKERQGVMEARNIRIGETGIEELMQWLRQSGQPQTLEALTERYIAILQNLVGVQEDA